MNILDILSHRPLTWFKNYINMDHGMFKILIFNLAFQPSQESQ